MKGERGRSGGSDGGNKKDRWREGGIDEGRGGRRKEGTTEEL